MRIWVKVFDDNAHMLNSETIEDYSLTGSLQSSRFGQANLARLQYQGVQATGKNQILSG